MKAELLATGEFLSYVVEETSTGVRARSDVPIENSLRLYRTGPSTFLVEWDAGRNGGWGFAAIGVWTDGTKKVVEYDGVFSLPRQVAVFLREQGFDTSEVEE